MATQLFATVYNPATLRAECEPFEIKDEQEIIDRFKGGDLLRYNTFEVETVTLDGEELKGKPKNYSKNNYLNVEKLHTPAEVVAEITTNPYPDPMLAMLDWEISDEEAGKAAKRSLQLKIDEITSKGPNAQFFLASPKNTYPEFVEVTQGMKVFDKKGAQLNAPSNDNTVPNSPSISNNLKP